MTDGGAVVENMGFPLAHTLSREPGHWVPTNLVQQQQLPLLPDWGSNRTFAMPPAPPAACLRRRPTARHRVRPSTGRQRRSAMRWRA